MDAELMETMLKEEGDMLTIIVEELSNPFTFITPADGQLSNLDLGQVFQKKKWEMNFVMQV